MLLVVKEKMATIKGLPYLGKHFNKVGDIKDKNRIKNTLK